MADPISNVCLGYVSWIFLFDVGSLGQWFSVFVASITVVVSSYFNSKNLKKKKKMVYSVFSQHHLFSVESENSTWMRDKFQVHYIDEAQVPRIVEEPYLLMIKFKNVGKSVIAQEDFDIPILLELPQSARILSEPIFDSTINKALTRSITHRILQDGKNLEINISTIHPGDFFSLMVITNGDPAEFVLTTQMKQKGCTFQESHLDDCNGVSIKTLTALCLICMVGVVSMSALVYSELCIYLPIVGLLMVGGILHFFNKISKDNNHD